MQMETELEPEPDDCCSGSEGPNNDNPKSNCSEVSSGRSEKISQEALHFRRIFPEEIWLMIFNSLTDSDGLTNSINSSQYFRPLLLDKRVLFLFQRVFPLIEETQFRPNMVPKDHTNWFSTLKNLRLVCKSWCAVIDTFFENICSGLESTPSHVQRRYHEPDLYGLDKFHLHFQHTHSNTGRSPIMGREVTFEFVPYTRPNAQFLNLCFVTNIKIFLRRYGAHIYYCTFLWEDKFNEHLTEFYEDFRELLELLPNLRVLDIQYQRVDMFFMPNGPWSHFQRKIHSTPNTKEELDQLQNQINLHPVPKMPNLKFIKEFNLPSPIFRNLVSQNSQLTRLVNFRTQKVELCYDMCAIPMPNLTKLAIRIADWIDINNFETFRTDWPLKMFGLDMGRCKWVHWNKILGLVQNKWADTLEHVTIKFPVTDWEREKEIVLKQTASARLNLPKVNHVALTVGNVCSFDFILPMKDTLESLEIRFDYGTEGKWVKDDVTLSMEAAQVITGLENTEELLSSNVWKLFPKLKKLSVKEGFLRDVSARDGNGRSIIKRSREYSEKCHTRDEWLKSKIHDTI